MLDNIFGSVLNLTSNGTTTLTIEGAIVCTLASLVMGMVIAFVYMYKNTYRKSFVMTLALLPAIVQIVIMLVNGNLGVGVAVMGAFNLVRFRSIPGSAREIGTIFMAMAIGLTTGMGYIGYGFVFLFILAIANILLTTFSFGEGSLEEKELKITIPENLDYADIFDDLFEKYAKKVSLVQVRTVNMGSMFELKYMVRMKSDVNEKEFIDAIRCRNGNLNISIGRPLVNSAEVL
ncbi:MAG: DUF4956 domain-containing protein [Lachnospiraceae bacterium]|nr:DUF4956 domain-containing protein [Lachnospiraceae bacterium]MBR3683909.1 DUF4956 domain-containing protein [Lachnospiraceae bacterium]